MTLCGMNSLLKTARENHYAVGAFNVANMEMVLGVVEAAEAEKKAVILQLSEGWDPYFPINLLGKMMIAAAEESKVDIVVHLDHAKTEEGIRKAIDTGFSSVMYDGSNLSIEENILRVKKIKKILRNTGISLEGELGVVGGAETGIDEMHIKKTMPEDVTKFCNETGVDALAISIGNMHGTYYNSHKLDYNILTKCAKVTETPLVLHGASGLSKEELQKTIKLGISKINIATANFDASIDAVKQIKMENGKNGFIKLSQGIIKSVKENTRMYIQLFNMGE